MKRVLVFQHVAYEVQGTLDPLLRARGSRIRYVNFGRDPEARPRVARYHGLIVLGGPMSADDGAGHPHLEVEVAAIRQALERDLPVLGICLGAQLLARALGARIQRSPRTEIGWHDVEFHASAARDRLFGHFARRERLFQWHRDSFELPPGADLLASSRSCPNQAFRFGERAYGLQFHLEADGDLIARWLATPDYRAGLPEGARPEAIEAETRQRAKATHRLAERTFTRFTELG